MIYHSISTKELQAALKTESGVRLLTTQNSALRFVDCLVYSRSRVLICKALEAGINLEITLRPYFWLWGLNDKRLGKPALCDAGVGAVDTDQATLDQRLPQASVLTPRGSTPERSPRTVRSSHEVDARGAAAKGRGRRGGFGAQNVQPRSGRLRGPHRRNLWNHLSGVAECGASQRRSGPTAQRRA